MFEYSSVSVSSYDPGALVAKLNESTADGWEVVAIVPTGGDVSAFLRREVPAADDGAGAAVVEGIEATTDEAGEVPVADAWAATEAPAEQAVQVEAAEVAATTDEPSFASDSWTSSDTTTTSVSETVAEEVEVPLASDTAVEEPAGWAAAPVAAAEVAAGEAEQAAGEAEQAASSGLGDAAAETAVVGAAVEDVVVTEQAAEPAPAAVPAAPAAAPEPAPVVTTPAGWYPDPSGRFELRYWDGTQWTEHVARSGQQFTDPPVR